MTPRKPSSSPTAAKIMSDVMLGTVARLTKTESGAGDATGGEGEPTVRDLAASRPLAQIDQGSSQIDTRA